MKPIIIPVYYQKPFKAIVTKFADTKGIVLVENATMWNWPDRVIRYVDDQGKAQYIGPLDWFKPSNRANAIARARMRVRQALAKAEAEYLRLKKIKFHYYRDLPDSFCKKEQTA